MSDSYEFATCCYKHASHGGACFEYKVELLKKHDTHHWSVEAVEHDGNKYALVSDGAYSYVIEEDDLHHVDEFINGSMSYHEWMTYVPAITFDSDLPDGFKQSIPDKWIAKSGKVCVHGSL